jgi:predicted amidohydrolase
MGCVRATLTVAAAQPQILADDLPANALAHVELIRRAQARVVVFPELSLTGYELGAQPMSLDDDAFASIVAACAETGSVALVGAPIRNGAAAAHIATVRVDAAGAEVAYRKTFLGGDEPGRFSPGDGPAALEVDGWRIGLGVCKDTGVKAHVSETAALGIDLYAAGLVHHAEELTEQERRASTIAVACNAYVAFASFAGPTGGGFARTAGVSSLWSADGAAIARAGEEPGDFVRATLR